MKKENILLAFWVLFGYLFISAITSIIYFMLHLIFFGLNELGVSIEIMKFILPPSTFILYGIVAVILIKQVDFHSKISKIYLTKFPRKLMITSAIIAFTLAPITNLLIGIYAGKASIETNIGFDEFMIFDDWILFSSTVAQIAVITVVLIMFFIRLRNFENKQSISN